MILPSTVFDLSIYNSCLTVCRSPPLYISIYRYLFLILIFQAILNFNPLLDLSRIATSLSPRFLSAAMQNFHDVSGSKYFLTGKFTNDWTKCMTISYHWRATFSGVSGLRIGVPFDLEAQHERAHNYYEDEIKRTHSELLAAHQLGTASESLGIPGRSPRQRGALPSRFQIPLPLCPKPSQVANFYDVVA